jgi:hypothetical protein
MRLRIPAVFALLVTPLFVAAGPPAAKPTVPALTAGARPPNSFEVTGIFRFSPSGGLAFRVAGDGARQLCAVYDPGDGTPLFLSDGRETLVYDLANDRVVRVPTSRGFVRVDGEPGAAKPLSFSIGVECKSDPEKLDEANSWFRVDRFAAGTPGLEHRGRRGDWEVFAARRADGTVDSLQTRPGDATRFRFTSTAGAGGGGGGGAGEASFDRLEVEAARIGEPLPAAALAFPDPKRLPPDVHLTDLAQQPLPAFLGDLRGGRAWLAKMVLAAGPDKLVDARKEMPEADWDALRARDARLGAAYRKALAEQGVVLPTYHDGAAASKPAG